MKYGTLLKKILILMFALSGANAMAAGGGCGAPCAPVCDPCTGSFNTGSYAGIYGGLQHARDSLGLAELDATGGGESRERVRSSDCSGLIGVNVGYLHRFCNVRCALGFEGFFDYSFAESVFHNRGISPDTSGEVYKQKRSFRFGGVVRPGYVLCDGHMLYGMLGGTYGRMELSLKTAETPPKDVCKNAQMFGGIFGVGWEIEWDCKHRIRLQVSHTVYGKVNEEVLGANGGFHNVVSPASTDLVIGYSYVF